MGNMDYKDGFKFKMLPHRLNEPKQNKKPNALFCKFYERLIT